ncbi:MAG: hypothetical protein MUF70_16760 [Myxococcota bacterium]|jgi:hypothetical protein|nr:hypothetical protein [Myxococcota bacterium]
MRRLVHRTIALALLGWIAVAAGTGVAKAATHLDHACCPNESRSEANDETPCQGFLPLSCCDAAALPTTAGHSAPLAPVLQPATAFLAPADSDRAPLPVRIGLAPRAAPLLRSIVLQL